MFSGYLSPISALQLCRCCQGPQGLLVFNNNGCAAATNKFFLLESAEQPCDSFTGNAEDFSEFLMGQGKPKPKSTLGLIIFVHIPFDKYSGKPFRCRV
ncbi:MAG TPA: hypothetical protein VEV41_24190 [Terriglobales bacterium]|nr:hypothetical protein [Terriglobales bacterium]